MLIAMNNDDWQLITGSEDIKDQYNNTYTCSNGHDTLYPQAQRQ